MNHPAATGPLTDPEEPTPTAHTWPLVTVAIPLYRSARFLSVIIENIETLDYPNLEYIISDRHSEDDALTQLAARYGHDTRIRFISATDRIDWIAHYNSLLDAASGTYMLWLPHDDSYPADYIRNLVSALEANPAALLAFGTIQPVTETGESMPIILAKNDWHACVNILRPWSVNTALRLLIYWNLGIPMRGLFRPAPLRVAGLYMKQTPYHAWADVFWMFGVALRGPLQFVPTVSCIKRYHPNNTHQKWPRMRGMRIRWQVFQILRSYAQEQISHFPAHVWAVLVLAIYQLLPRRLGHRLLRPLVGNCSNPRAASIPVDKSGAEPPISTGK